MKKYIIILLSTLSILTLLIFLIFGMDIKIVDNQLAINVNNDYLISKYCSGDQLIIKNGSQNSTYNWGRDLNSAIELKTNVKFRPIIKSNDLEFAFDVSDDSIKALVDELNKNRKATVITPFTIDEDGLHETEVVQGNKINEEAFLDAIKKLDKTKPNTINIDEYVSMETDKREEYERLIANQDVYNMTLVSYPNNSNIYVSDLNDCLFVNNNNEITFIEDTDIIKKSLKKVLQENLKEYETVGNGIVFNTTNGDSIIVTGGTYGDSVDYNKEIDTILDGLLKMESQSRDEIIYAQQMKYDFSNEYIEVSINDQHCWHYKDQVLCCESDVVTGLNNGKRNTPTGAYFVCEKVNGKYLTGDTWRTWVDKWMRLTWSGIGLHDAKWRKKFGEDIYQHNGSHGCVNLPINYAYSLYKEIYIGMPVVIY